MVMAVGSVNKASSTPPEKKTEDSKSSEKSEDKKKSAEDAKKEQEERIKNTPVMRALDSLMKTVEKTKAETASSSGGGIPGGMSQSA